MNPCTCKDWQTTAETLMDFCSIGEMYYCPWCGTFLEDVESTSEEEPPDEPEAA